MKNPLVSVIVTTYNVENYIERCLSDISSQTYENIEIIVVDDGSTDSTPQILKKYSLFDKRLKLFLQEENSPGGVAHAANIGLKNVEGEYVCFADGDDLFSNDYVERLLEKAITDNSDLVICDFLDFDNTTKYTVKPYDPFLEKVFSDTVVVATEEIKKDLLKLNPVPWRKLYKTAFLKKCNILFKECPYFFEDNSFHWFNILQCERVSFVFDKLVWHRMNRKGQTMTASSNSMIGMLYQHEVIVEFLKNKKLWEAYQSEAFEWLLGTMIYLIEKLPVTFREKFFDILKREFQVYSLGVIRSVMLKNSYDFKIQNILFAILSNNYQVFTSALDNNLSLSIVERLRKNYCLQGLSKLIKKVANFFLHKFKSKFSIKNESINLQNETLVTLRANNWELFSIKRLQILTLLLQNKDKR